MFKITILLLCTLAIAVTAAPRPEDEEVEKREKHIVPIIKSEINKHHDGSYDLHYESGDGTERKEEATVIDAGTEDEALEIKGSYKYINAEGEEVEVFYTAGKNGFVPYGSTINKEITAAAEAAKNLPEDEHIKFERKGHKVEEEE